MFYSHSGVTKNALEVHLCGLFASVDPLLTWPLYLHATHLLYVWPFYTYIGPFTTIWPS